MFDCLGGNTPPERNTAWNKGRKCCHCLGAPNNLIRPCKDTANRDIRLGRYNHYANFTNTSTTAGTATTTGYVAVHRTYRHAAGSPVRSEIITKHGTGQRVRRRVTIKDTVFVRHTHTHTHINLAPCTVHTILVTSGTFFHTWHCDVLPNNYCDVNRGWEHTRKWRHRAVIGVTMSPYECDNSVIKVICYCHSPWWRTFRCFGTANRCWLFGTACCLHLQGLWVGIPFLKPKCGTRNNI